MNKDKILTEKESLELITSMIQKVKGNFHERGTSAILWGSVVGFCGLFSFFKIQFKIDTGWFDIWYLTLLAIIPQIFLSIKEKGIKVKTHKQEALNAVWLVYGISVFGVVAYGNIVPYATANIFESLHEKLLVQNTITMITEDYSPQVYSQSSLLLLIYAFPTMVTGIANKFKPMIYGALFCYVLFIASLFTMLKYDMLFNGIAGIFNWLIPGLILRSRFKKGIPC